MKAAEIQFEKEETKEFPGSLVRSCRLRGMPVLQDRFLYSLQTLLALVLELIAQWANSKKVNPEMHTSILNRNCIKKLVRIHRNDGLEIREMFVNLFQRSSSISYPLRWLLSCDNTCLSKSSFHLTSLSFPHKFMLFWYFHFLSVSFFLFSPKYLLCLFSLFINLTEHPKQ